MDEVYLHIALAPDEYIGRVEFNGKVYKARVGPDKHLGRVDLENGKAYPRVKVWPRGEDEPKEWTLEAEDPQPNLEGSAGIYAYSMTPLYFDNVRIYR